MKNKKKIVIEVILIPICIMYLYYEVLHNHPKVSLGIATAVIILTSIEFIVKYIKEVYVYKSKNNLLKILYVIFSFILIILSIISLFLKYKLIKIAYFISLIILLVFLLYFITKNIVRIIKEKGTLYKNTFAAFFSLISFVIVLINIIIRY